MDTALLDLYHQHIALAYDWQMRLNDFLQREADGENWCYTVSTATLEFGTNVKLSALDLGSYAEPDGSWLWTWCNPQMKLTAENRRLRDQVRELGRQASIDAFLADRQVSCAEILGEDLAPITTHVMAAIVGVALGFDAYYTLPFHHGTVALVIQDERLRIEPEHPVARIAFLFPQVISSFPVPNHPAAFRSYVESYGFACTESPRLIRVESAGQEVLKAKFDSKRRMTDLKASIAPDH